MYRIGFLLPFRACVSLLVDVPSPNTYLILLPLSTILLVPRDWVDGVMTKHGVIA